MCFNGVGIGKLKTFIKSRISPHRCSLHPGLTVFISFRVLWNGTMPFCDGLGPLVSQKWFPKLKPEVDIRKELRHVQSSPCLPSAFVASYLQIGRIGWGTFTIFVVFRGHNEHQEISGRRGGCAFCSEITRHTEWGLHIRISSERRSGLPVLVLSKVRKKANSYLSTCMT